MPDTPERTKNNPDPPALRPSFRPDLASAAGIAIALAGILGGLILEKGSIQDIAQGTAAMIVLGGTIGAVLVTTPLSTFIGAVKRLGSVFFERVTSPAATIDALMRYSTLARKNGIVSLEDEAATIADPFLRKALSLAVDGTDLQEIRSMMETDLIIAEESAEAEARVWESAGGYAPTVGIIGAVLGLIQVMKHLEDIKEVGHGIAVAFVATVYGVGSANVFFLPAANKLRARIRRASLLKEMTLEGVAAIVEGRNPTMLRLKLEAFHQPLGKASKRVAAKPAAQPEAARSPRPASASRLA